MSSPKQTAPVTDESEITTIPAGEAAAQATPSETARHDETPANTTTDPTMPATTTHQQTAPPDPTIHELPTESSPRPTQDAITTTHLQLPPPTTDLSSLNSPPPQETGLGPAIDAPITPSSSTSNSPLLSITLMLTTGARHPYKLDEKYLRSRKVTTTFDPSTGEFDPRLLSGYQLKELIWIDWRSEWEPRPANPSFIRLIVMGRLIEDKGVLKDYPLNLTTPNVVHMTVKPADLFDEDENNNGGKTSKQGAGFRRGGGGSRSGDAENEDGEGGAGCRCVIL